MNHLPTPNSWTFAILSMLFLVFQSCEETVSYREGRPPRDQKVWISESKLDSTMIGDSMRSSLFVTYRVDWEIDPDAFENGTFRLAMSHDSVPFSGNGPLYPVWLPKSRSIHIDARKGTFFDTSTSLGARAYWPNFKVHVMESIGGGDYLDVAVDSIVRKDVMP